MNWRKNFGPRTVGFQILLLVLLSFILIGSSITAEVQNNNNNKPATIANLEFVNVELRQTLRYLAGAGGFQALLDPGVQGLVNIAFNAKIPVKDAAIALATSSGFNFRWLGDGSTLYIGNSTLSDSSLQNKVSRTLTLKYVDPAVAVDSLTAVIPKTRITVAALAAASAKTKEKQLTITATELEWQNITEIIRDLDRVLPQLNIETRLVELPETYFKELDRNLYPTPTRMGAYPLTNEQLQLMESFSQFNNLYRREIPVFDGQAGTLALEDQIPKVQEKSQEGSVNYQIENLAVGSNVSVALHPGSGAKLALWIHSKVGTIANTTPPKDGAGYVPTLNVRELTSIVSWEPEQKFLLTGLIQRSEFNRLLNIPYKFPVLNDLFLGQNIQQPAQNSATQTVMVIIPQIKDQGAGAKTNSEAAYGAGGGNPSPTGNRTETKTTDSDFATIPGATEEKVTLNLDSSLSGKISPTPSSRPGSTLKPAVQEGITRIPYIVKKGDNLTRIAAKFGVTVQAIISENNLEASGIIKFGTTLVIPVNSDRIYTIKPKETLWRIAKRYGVSLEELKDLNGIADIKKVDAGQQIVLPVPVHQIKNPQF